MIYVPQHNEYLMPIRLGSVLRCPYASWDNWGIGRGAKETSKILDRSEGEYRKEWDLGTPEQHKIVADASIRAGFGDHNQKLRQAVAQYAAQVANDYPRGMRILDVGAGAGDSAIAVASALPEGYRGKVRITLLEPAANPLRTASGKMTFSGVKYNCVNTTDTQIPGAFEPGSYDVVTGVASIHHHARIPWEIYLDALKSGGRMVVGDWHNGVWIDSAKVYTMLERLGCGEEGLRDFQRTYVVDGMKSPLTQADTDIMDFWKGYQTLLEERGEQGRNAIWPLEGHRPVDMYLNEMEDAGFRGMESTPILPHTELLALTTAQKR